LITDFWAAYDSVDAADRQKCIPHLLRELEKVDLRNDSAEWQAFAKKLRRLLRDGPGAPGSPETSGLHAPAVPEPDRPVEPPRG
jgi:hypothetical protein